MKVYVEVGDTLHTNSGVWRLKAGEPERVIVTDTFQELCTIVRELVDNGTMERVPWRDRLSAWWGRKTYRWRHWHGRNTQT